MDALETISAHESRVRSYVRRFPRVFVRASGAWLIDDTGRRYLDFFAGAGALNYGHNPPPLKSTLLAYLADDGLVHGLDFASRAKADFIDTFVARVLAPRGLDYRLLFPGPTGANAVEAALKLARLATGRRHIVALRGGYHGMSLGALATTGNPMHRAGAGTTLPDTSFLPLPPTETCADPDMLVRWVASQFDRVEAKAGRAAGCIVEPIQGEAGAVAIPSALLRALRHECDARAMVLIADDIQAGCGRSGQFFSFEAAGIVPDIVCLSKSLSGYGLPMSLVLLRDALDVLQPGQHSGTFRGNNAAFVTARAALDHYWADDGLMTQLARHEARVVEHFDRWSSRWPSLVLSHQGRGLLRGLCLRDTACADAVQQAALAHGLIIETAGAGNILKLLCPLTLSTAELDDGLARLEAALATASSVPTAALTCHTPATTQ